MEKLILGLKEIFELDELDMSKKFEDFEEWDSLSSLSVIAMLDSDYKITISNKELLQFESLHAFCNFVEANGQK